MNSHSWLIRHSDLTFSRPISKDELIRKIESGEIISQDEICAGDGYWFSIQEVEEVKKHFGEIRLQSMIPNQSETTSATSTTPLAKAAQRVLEDIKASASKQKKIVSSEVDEDEEPHSRRALFFGILLSVIFFGTLGLLWMGSH